VEFLGIGYQELLLVMVLMLIVVGPERLPGVAYQIGRAVRTMQQYARAVRDEFREEIDYIEEQYKTVKGEVDVTRQSLRDQQAQFESELRQSTAMPELTAPPSNEGGGPADSNVVPFPTSSGGEAGAAPTEGEAKPEGEAPDNPPPLVF
jgi:sec-independent protein translocase protein TatB